MAVPPDPARGGIAPNLTDLQNSADDAVTAANALWLAALGFAHAPEGEWKEETIQLMALASADAARRVAEQVTQLRASLLSG